MRGDKGKQTINLYREACQRRASYESDLSARLALQGFVVPSQERLQVPTDQQTCKRKCVIVGRRRTMRLSRSAFLSFATFISGTAASASLSLSPSLSVL